MKKTIRNSLAVLLGIVLIVSMLPAATAAESNPRDVVVAQANAIATVDWTLAGRIKKTDITGTRLDFFHENGLFPTTYFEYHRLYTVMRGMLFEANQASFERFTGMMTGEPRVEGIGHIPKQTYYGMDPNSFLTDIISRVSTKPITSFEQALTDDSLTALMTGVDLSQSSSKAAMPANADAAYAAYDKLGAGDLLLAYDKNADVDSNPRKHVMVVKSVDPANDKVTVIYPGYSLLLWYMQCSQCGYLDIYGPSSAALPNHIASTSSSFGSFKKHSDTYPESGCSGSWQPQYGTNWHTETVSYAQLLGQGSETVPYGSVGYLPYTLDAYTADSVPEVKVTSTSTTTPENISGGLNVNVSSNYRLTTFEATLTEKGGQTQTFVSYADWDSWTYQYSNEELNTALLLCEPGDYNLTLTVKSGPVTDSSTMAVPTHEVFNMDFTLVKPTFKLTSNSTFVNQGDGFTVSLNALTSGYSALDGTISYDAERYEFNADTTKMANASTAITDNGDGTISLSYRGKALEAGKSAAYLFFTAKRTGNDPMTAEDIDSFLITSMTGATDPNGEMLILRTDNSPLQVATGYNAVIYKNYAGGNDLILVYMLNQAMAEKSEGYLTYKGKTMLDVTESHYSINGNSFICIFAALVPNADMNSIGVGSTLCPEIKYSQDVNMSGWTDMNDVQTIANIYKGNLPLTGNETKWLRADINRDGKVDINDQTELMKTLMN